MSTIKVGIIGCGGIANGKHMPSLKTLAGVEQVAFCDIDATKAEKAAQEYGVQGATVYTSYMDLLNAGGVDVIHVCTPNISHDAIAIAALQAGNHVMCEKPMAKTSAGARLMRDVARESGKKLTIGYQSRHRPDSQYLKQLIEDGELGEVYFAKAHAIRRRAVPTWGVFLDEEAQGGGPLIDIGTHALDLTLWLMNNYNVKSVKGSVYRKLAERENSANAWGPWDPKQYTVEDSAFGFIELANGATIFLESSWALNTRETGEAICTLYGTDAGADMRGGLHVNGEKNSRLYDLKVDLGGGGVAFYDGATAKAEHIEAQKWIDAIRNDTEPVVTPDQALVVSEILEAIYESSKTGQLITF
jgi:predicted dehydrogenase